MYSPNKPSVQLDQLIVNLCKGPGTARMLEVPGRGLACGHSPQQGQRRNTVGVGAKGAKP